MKRFTRIFIALAAAFALSGSALAATPAADVPQSFDVLQGIDASALDGVEMDAIHGALSGQDVFNALLAKAQLIQDTVLRDRVVSSLLANQTQLVNFFNRLLSFRR